MIESERKRSWSSGCHRLELTLEALRSLSNIEPMRYIIVRPGNVEGVGTVWTWMVEKDSLFKADHRGWKTSIYCGSRQYNSQKFGLCRSL
jgi:hypothetical protein